jgi:hypothetical protein
VYVATAVYKFVHTPTQGGPEEIHTL